MSAARVDRLLTLTRPDADLHAWLSEALEQWCRGGVSLDRVLGLTGPTAIRARDAALRRAACLLDNGGSTWETAGTLARAVNHFETTAWKRLRHQPPGELPALKQALFDAFAATALGRLRMPCSQRGLWDLIH